MDFLDIGKQIARMGAPILGGLLGGPPGAALGGMIASALGDEVDPNDPASIAKALRDNPDAALKLRQLELEHKETLQQMAIQAESNRLQAEANQLAEVNATMRAEYAQSDSYVRRWRPTLGYGVTFSWVTMWMAVAYTLMFEPSRAPDVVAALAGTSILWGVALSVLGVSVSARSQDKIVAAGGQPSMGIMAAIASRIGSKKNS